MRSRPLVRGLLLGGALLLSLDAAAVRLGRAPGLVPTFDLPAIAWMSRALGVTALLALTLSMLCGLLLATRGGARVLPKRQSLELHRWLSAGALGLTALHALVLLFDRVAHLDVLDALVPFLSSWRPFAVGLGVLAAWGAWVVHASEGWRARLGGRAWRRLHALAFAVFAAAVLHGVLAAPPEAPAWATSLYIGCGLAVALAAAARVAEAFARRARAA